MTRGRKRTAALLGACLLSIAVLLAAIVILLGPGSARVIWDRASGRPVPPKFMYVMFPVRAEVALQDSHSQAIGRFLDRAILVSEEELAGSGRVSVFFDEQETYVSRHDLAFTAAPGLMDVQINRLREAIRRWGDSTDWHDLAFSTDESESPQNLTLRVRLRGPDGGSIESRYQSVGGHDVTPVALLQHGGR